MKRFRRFHVSLAQFAAKARAAMGRFFQGGWRKRRNEFERAVNQPASAQSHPASWKSAGAQLAGDPVNFNEASEAMASAPPLAGARAFNAEVSFEGQQSADAITKVGGTDAIMASETEEATRATMAQEAMEEPGPVFMGEGDAPVAPLEMPNANFDMKLPPDAPAHRIEVDGSDLSDIRNRLGRLEQQLRFNRQL